VLDFVLVSARSVVVLAAAAIAMSTVVVAGEGVVCKAEVEVGAAMVVNIFVVDCDVVVTLVTLDVTVDVVVLVTVEVLVLVTVVVVVLVPVVLVVVAWQHVARSLPDDASQPNPLHCAAAAPLLAR
jgi:hypothetical protein